MKYKIIDIIEEDHGCEGIPEGSKRMDTVILEDSKGSQISIKYSDSELYEKNLNNGSIVMYDGKFLTLV